MQEQIYMNVSNAQETMIHDILMRARLDVATAFDADPRKVDIEFGCKNHDERKLGWTITVTCPSDSPLGRRIRRTEIHGWGTTLRQAADDLHLMYKRLEKHFEGRNP